MQVVDLVESSPANNISDHLMQTGFGFVLFYFVNFVPVSEGPQNLGCVLTELEKVCALSPRPISRYLDSKFSF